MAQTCIRDEKLNEIKLHAEYENVKCIFNLKNKSLKICKLLMLIYSTGDNLADDHQKYCQKARAVISETD